MNLEEVEEQIANLKQKIEELEHKNEDKSDEINTLKDEMAELYQDRKFLKFGAPKYSNGVIDLYLKESGLFQDWLITLHNQRRQIGYITLTYFNNSYGNIGYEIVPKYRGHHYASQAINLLKQEMLSKNLKSPLLVLQSDNVASVKTAIYAGAKPTSQKDSKSEIYTIDLEENLNLEHKEKVMNLHY